MTIEGDYIVFTPEETVALPSRCDGDQWTFITRTDWMRVSTMYGGYENATSHGRRYSVRRLRIHCTPEQLAMAGGGTESMHFL